MRRTAWLLVGIAALAALWWWAPSAYVRHRVTSLVRAHIGEQAGLTVRARTTAWSLALGRIGHLEIEAANLPLGDTSARRFWARMAGVRLAGHRGDGPPIRGIESGSAQVEVGQDDLERLLTARGIANPRVVIDAGVVTATGQLRVGPVFGPATVRGQFYAADRADVHFRVASFEVGGTELPPALANTVLAIIATPVLSLRGLPVPVEIDQVALEAGRVIIRARVMGAPR